MPGRMSAVAGRSLSVIISLAVTVLAGSLVTAFLVMQLRPSGHDEHAGPADTDFVDIRSVPVDAHQAVVFAGGSTGSFTDRCGRDADGRHRNADNVIAEPGRPGGAHHTHDYVGNLSTTAFSTDTSLAAAATTCVDGDRSTFYWPVVRIPGSSGPDVHAVGGGADGNLGQIIAPVSVDIRFLGNPVSAVVPMPRFLRASVGDPRALTDGAATIAAPQWSCTGYADRVTRLYPLCPNGSDVLRVFDFPSCWDGRSVDSPTHHAHLVAPAGNGVCPHATFPVPHLRLTLTYAVPVGTRYAIDTFGEQRRSPLTDHADFIDVMADQLQARVVSCINTDRQC